MDDLTDEENRLDQALAQLGTDLGGTPGSWHGMSWFTDLVDAGTSALKQNASTAVGQPGALQNQSAHIAAQNQVVADFGTIINAFNASQISTQDAINRIQVLDNGFQTYTNALNYPRAIQGQKDVHALAVKVVADFQNRSGQNQFSILTGSGTPPGLPGVVGTTVTGAGVITPVTTTQPLSAGIGGFSWQTIGLAALALWALKKNRVF